MKTIAFVLFAIASLNLVGCESKPDSAKPASTTAAPAGSAKPAGSGW